MTDKIFGEARTLEWQVASILEREVCQQMDDAARFDKYSGRSMMGQNCPAIMGTDQQCRQTIAQLMFVISQHSLEWVTADPGCRDDINDMLTTMTQLIMNFKVDTWGQGGVVYYWPNMKAIWRT